MPEEKTLTLVEAAIAHHLLDAANALEHLRVDLARDDVRKGTRERAAICHAQLQQALAILREEP